jgi:hypothetical protein
MLVSVGLQDGCQTIGRQFHFVQRTATGGFGEFTGRVVFEDDSSVMSVNVDAAMFLDDHTMAIDRSPWSSLSPTVPKGRSRAVDVVILLLLPAITAVMGWTQMMQSDQNYGLIERKNFTPPPKVESNTEDAKKEVR